VSLRRAIESARLHDWHRGLRWFAAEFLVVVSGVLVALALGAWWQERADREREGAYLRQLAADLESTERSLQWVAAFHLESALAAARVGQAFWKPEPPTLAELSHDLARPFRSLRQRPVLGTIEALIATGDLRLVRSNSLRTELTSYAEFAEATVENIQRHDETYYRPGVNALVENLDTNQLVHETVPGDPTNPLSFRAAGERRVPFPTDIDELLGNRTLYSAYQNLLTAHRNQGLNYARIMERARRLRGEVHREMHGSLDPGNCQLEIDGERYVGRCGDPQAVRGEFRITLSRPEAVQPPPAEARDTAEVLTGRWKLGRADESEIRIEVDPLTNGRIRSSQGEVPISGFDESGFDFLGDDRARVSFRIEPPAGPGPNRRLGNDSPEPHQSR